VSSTRSRLVVSSLVTLVVVGCSHQEFSKPALRRPGAVIGDLFDSGAPYVKPGKSPAEQRMERLARVLAAWQAHPGNQASDYRIGPGDVLEVSIFALEEPDKTTTLTRTVSQDGWITLPWVGSVRAGGLSAGELEEATKKIYAGRYLKDPQVTVTVAEYRSAAVVVSGAVREPGVYYLTGDRSTILSMLALAGGLTEGAGDRVLVIRSAESAPAPTVADAAAEVELVGKGGGPAPARRTVGSGPGESRATTIDLKELVDEGNLLLNLPVSTGDVITVPARKEQYVYVLGYVQRPGAYELKDGVRVNALRAIAMAQGLSVAARAENSVLIRETAKGQIVVPVDLTKIARNVRPPIYLEPGDTLIVGSSTIARLTEFVRPSIGAGLYY